MKNTFLPLGIFVAGLLAGCNAEQPAVVGNNNFPVTTPILLDTTYVREYVADIQAVQNVEIRARLKGFIEKIHVDEGEGVRAGELLFSISNQEFKQELLKAKAQLKSAIAESKIAEVEVGNTRVLAEKKIVSNSEFEMAKAKLEAAQAKIDEAQSAVSSAQLNLAFTEIRAPFSGVINRQPLKMGSLVDEGTLLTTISDNSSVFAYFNVSEKEYLGILKEDQTDHLEKVSLVLADGHIFPYSGKVETAESEIDRSTGNLAFRARFTNPQGLLKHGASGKVQLTGQLENALVIPQKATFEIQENTYLYVVGPDSTVQTRKIVVRYRLPHLFIVESGLAPTDRIVYEGIQQLREGDVISPKMVAIRRIMHQLAAR
jgi:RND family efflux transporter MFP subunit